MENHQEKTEISRQIDERISALADWRGETLRQIRGIVLETVSGVSEDLKWRGTPVWSLNGILCTGEVYQDKVKVTFQKGAQLDDSWHLFNASLDGNQRRAIDFHKGDAIPRESFLSLLAQAVALNAPPQN